MYFLRLVFCCLTICDVSKGIHIQGIIGGNVSLTWTFNNIRDDAILIMHDTSLFLQVWPVNNYIDPPEHPNRVRVALDESANGTVMLTVSFMNITKNDSGKYRAKWKWNSEEFNDTFLLETIDETMTAKIEIFPQTILDSTLILECRLSNTSKGRFSWSLNGSLIESHGRYFTNESFMSITNLTVGDYYSSYKCKELGTGFESDPYNINSSGPNTVMFAPHSTMVPEDFVVSVSCLADCFPICTYFWSKLDPRSGREKFISAEKALYIKNSTRQDAGTYSCKVLNKITGISLENYTSLEIVYGPDTIVFNSSDKIIELDENDSITISCSSDCSPPCQIGWIETHTDKLITTAEMKIVNVKVDGNYTCRAMNPRKNNTTISDTVYIIVKSGINQYSTAALNPETDAEGFPSKRHFLYIVLGMGTILVFAFFACILHKMKNCLRAITVSKSNKRTDSNLDNGDADQQDENLPGKYWTIISNERGELSTAIETNFAQSRVPPIAGQIILPGYNESEQSIQFDGATFNEELDGYLNPIHSHSVELDEYIHPVHSCPVESDEYIHPVHSVNVNTEIVFSYQSTEV